MAQNEKRYSQDRTRLQALLAYPGENLSREYKGWLDLSSNSDKATLAKALLAMANHGGGYVILGFTESKGPRPEPEFPRPSDLSAYRQDVINNIVKRYAEPRFHTEVQHVPHPESGYLFPIIKVPGGHRVPIRSRSEEPGGNIRINTYYTRRPGPESAPPETAREWDELIGRCIGNAGDDMVDQRRTIFQGAPQPANLSEEENAKSELQQWIAGSRSLWEERRQTELPNERPSRYAHGIWTVGYSLIGDFASPELKEFVPLLQSVVGNETGWPVWWVPSQSDPIEAPYFRHNAFECWMKDVSSQDAAYSDFWRASPKGLMFLLRGYLEDCKPDQVDPGKALWVHTPISDVGECLLHAKRLSTALGDESASVMFSFKWEGLSGRTLRYWGTPKGKKIWFDRANKTCHQHEVSSPIITVPANEIPAKPVELVHEFTKELYEVFNLYEVELAVIQRELSKLTEGSP